MIFAYTLYKEDADGQRQRVTEAEIFTDANRAQDFVENSPHLFNDVTDAILVCSDGCSFYLKWDGEVDAMFWNLL